MSKRFPTELPRRNFLALLGAVSLAEGKTLLASVPKGSSASSSPTEVRGKLDAGILTATLTWQNLAAGAGQAGAAEVRIRVSRDPDLSRPVLAATVAGDATPYRFAVAPSTTYYWSVVPVTKQGEVPARAARGTFTTAAPSIDPKAGDDAVRYAGVRTGVHWGGIGPIAPASPPPPLSPWFYKKRYDGVKPPKFEEVKASFPVPVIETEPQLLDAYWYCWKTLTNVWLYPPPDPVNAAVVSNNLGCPDWAGWGSVEAWDTAFMVEFGRYGHPAYPFINAYDNYYARQHENGFICREADNNGHEVYAGWVLTPPLYAWAEWESYQLTGNQERLAQVLTPIVKFYEWWLRFQRRPNGLFWNRGGGEGMDDSPRNPILYDSCSASSYLALAALSIARIAKVVGRPDLVNYFESQYAALGKVVNDYFWDEKHQLYNDRVKDGRFITELEPGVFCKHGYMFWPLLAEIVPPDRVQALIRMLFDPKQFYVSSGVASLSVDSKYYNAKTGQYWHGSVWPPIQCIVQKGLKLCGQWDRAQQLAQKYLNAVVTAYQKQHTITENLRPGEPVGEGHDEFVGWGGIGPVQDLIEYVLGFDVSAPAQTVTWRITRVDRHGLENLYVGRTKVDLLCASRQSPTAPCHLTIKSDARLTLIVHLNGATTTLHIRPGVTQQVVG